MKGKLILFLKYGFALVVLWFIIYFEPINIGPLKISQIWKGVLALLILFYLTSRKFPFFVLIGMLYSVKYLFYSHMPNDYIDAIRLTMEDLIFPISIGFFLVYFRAKIYKLDQLIYFSIFISLFLILSNIPFFFGVESLYEEYDLSSKYGIEFSATKGLFYHIASASKMFTVATLLLIVLRRYFWTSFFSKLFWIFLILLGSYLIVMSWTRTAWFIYFIGLMIVVFYDSSLKVKFFGLLLSCVFFFFVTYMYNTNDAFRWRMTGGASYREEQELSLDQLASARIPYVVIAIDNLNDEGIAAWFIGHGEGRGKELFYKKSGMAITSHNKTFEILESSGLVGLILYFSFVFLLLYKVLLRVRFVDPVINKACMICVYMFLVFYFTSHGTPIWGELIYAAIFSYVILLGNCYKK